MRRIVDFAVAHARLTLAILIFLLAAGALSYQSIPKEANPDVTIPIIYVQLSERGISPEDAERLLVKPMETALKSIANIKSMKAAGFEGGGYVLMEFDAGFDSAKALQDVRAKVDDGKRDLPADADEPGVHEVNLSLFPVVILTLSGDLSERARRRDDDSDTWTTDTVAGWSGSRDPEQARAAVADRARTARAMSRLRRRRVARLTMVDLT